MATTVCATLSAIVGTVPSNCASCSDRFGWGGDVGGVRDALAAGLLDLGREGHAEAVGRAAAGGELAVADPVVDRAVCDAEALGDLAHAQFAGGERRRRRDLVAPAKPLRG